MASGTLNDDLLEKGLAVVEAAAQWSPRVVSKLEAVIRGDDELALFRVNPIRFAIDNSIDETEAIDLFLHATKAGLFEMEWVIVCASCGNRFKSFRNLEKVDPHFRCNVCNMENTSSLDEFIQVMFTISPAIRDTVLHHPDQLTLEQDLFDFRFSQDARAQYDGLSLPELIREWTARLEYLDPGESTSLDVHLEGGGLVIRDVIGSTSVAFFEQPDAPPGDSSVSLQLAESGFGSDDTSFSEFVLKSSVGSFFFPKVHFLGQGRLTISCVNDGNSRLPFWALRYPPLDGFEPQTIEFDAFLSAKRLLSTATFHRLFRAEVPPQAEGLSVDDLTYLFTDLKGSTSMYDEIGDATAYNLVRLHFDVLGKAVSENYGAIVKTIGDAVMATFVEPAHAVSAAFAMFQSLDEFNRSMSTALGLKVGIHRGYAIAVTLNDSLDYFGQNVNIAARTQQLAGSGEILITQDIFEEEGVADLLAGHELKPVADPLLGVSEQIALYRLEIVTSAET